jgi:hypothetical protein
MTDDAARSWPTLYAALATLHRAGKYASQTRVKTTKVSFALTTPNRSLVVTDRRVPAPAVAEIALGVPARKVRGLTMNLPVRERVGQ